MSKDLMEAVRTAAVATALQHSPGPAPAREQFAADPANRPARCVYIVRFWMANVGYGRREWEADNAWQAGFQVEGHIRSTIKDADVVVIGVVRK